MALGWVVKAAAVIGAVSLAGLVIVDLSTEEGDLEEIFIALTRAAAQPAVVAP